MLKSVNDLIISIKAKLSNNVKFKNNLEVPKILHFINYSILELLTDSLVLNKTTNLYEINNVDYNLISNFIRDLIVEKQELLNKDIFNLPDNCLLPLDNTYLLDSNNNQFKIKSLKTSTSDNFYNLPYYKDNCLFINVIIFNNKIELINKNQNITKLRLFYLKKPEQVTLETTYLELNNLYFTMLVDKVLVNIGKSYDNVEIVNLNKI